LGHLRLKLSLTHEQCLHLRLCVHKLHLESTNMTLSLLKAIQNLGCDQALKVIDLRQECNLMRPACLFDHLLPHKNLLH
jgi:hypothetical protein